MCVVVSGSVVLLAMQCMWRGLHVCSVCFVLSLRFMHVLGVLIIHWEVLFAHSSAQVHGESVDVCGDCLCVCVRSCVVVSVCFFTVFQI